LYRYHTLFPGGLKEIPYEEVLATYPDRAIINAVWGMLPKGPLGRRLLKKLKIYPGSEHNHAAQNPRPLEI
jgi:large subunit ribosomal protein L13